MISVFSPEAFSDYLDNEEAVNRSSNGDIVLQPSSCDLTAELGGTWELRLSHSYDVEGRYTYLQKGAVIKCPAKVAREQQTENQLFRIFEVDPGDKEVEVTAYPVAMESIYETPINYKEFNKMTASEVVTELNSMINNNKYTVVTDISSNKKYSTYIENSNLQEYLNGDQDSTFVNAYGGEVIYDNYTYRIVEAAGAVSSNDILYAKNLKGIEIEESTTDMITRIYPTSSEGYGYSGGSGSDARCVNSDRIQNYPFVYAKSIKYDDITYVEDVDETDKTPLSKTAKATKAAKTKLKNYIQSRSKYYLDKARNGEWDHSDIDSRGYPEYWENIHEPRLNPSDHSRDLRPHRDRFMLPYGYIFQSYTDVIGLLIQNTLATIFDPTKDQDVYNILAEAIKDGFKWCEDQDNTDYKWDWVIKDYYNDEEFGYLGNYHWYIITDPAPSVGTNYRYGDENGHYLTNAWVEDVNPTSPTGDITNTFHAWVDENGIWNTSGGIISTGAWSWHTNDTGQWYGYTDSTSGQTDYPLGQFMWVNENKQWYKFDSNGYWVQPDGERKYYGVSDLKDAEYVFAKFWKVSDTWYWFNNNGTIDEFFNYIDTFEFMEEDEDAEDRTYSITTTTTKTVSVTAGSTTKTTTTTITKHNNDTDTETSTTTTETEEMEEAAEETKSETTSEDKDEDVVKQWYGDGKGHYVKSAWVEKDQETHYWINDDGYIDPVFNDTSKWDWSGSRDNGDGSGGWYYGSTEDDNDNKAMGQYMYVTANSTWYYFTPSTDKKPGRMVAAWMSTADWKWRKDKYGYYFGDGSETFLEAQWLKIDGKWFWFDTGGYADKYTDDFKKVDKAGTTNTDSTTYQENRDGISLQSMKESSDDTAVYDENREGVKAWLQTGFLNDVVDKITEIHDDLYDVMNELLEDAAKKDLAVYDHPSLSIKVNFNVLYGTPGYEEFAFLKDYYLGDWVVVNDTKHSISTAERITGLTYNCISEEVTDVSIGAAVNTFIKDIAKLNVKSTIKEYFP